MGVTIGATTTTRYNTQNKDFNYRAGVEIGSDTYAYTTPFIADGAIGVGYPSANARLKLGGEIPIVRSGCHKWFRDFSMAIYGEGKGEASLVKTKDTGTAKDGQHTFMLDGGGGIDFTYRTYDRFEGALGVKGGYKYESVISKDKALRQECTNGQAYVGPAVRLHVNIPETGCNGYKSGLGFDVRGVYDVLHKQLEATATISYTF